MYSHDGGFLKKLFFNLIILILLLFLGYWYFSSKPEKKDIHTEKVTVGKSTVKLMTWNLFNFGKSKTDTEITFFAKEMKDFDIVAVQEISTGNYGAKAIAKLADELNRIGSKWDYVISDATSGEGSERYAFLWKPFKVKLAGKPWLEQTLESEIDREPFLARFEFNGRKILLATIHAVPKEKHPKTECKLLSKLSPHYPDDNIMIMGDFNLSQKDDAFDGLKKSGFEPSIVAQKTSLKMKGSPDGEHLANEYDNIFYEINTIKKVKSGVVDFSLEFNTLHEARTISDHIPVFLEFSLN